MAETIRVIQAEGSRWATEVDDARESRIYYASRGAAISAGVQMAMAEDAVLMIHGSDHFSSGFDFRGCKTGLVN